jgi:predicted nicotinamide N-methyase
MSAPPEPLAQRQQRRSHVTYTFAHADAAGGGGPATVTLLENRGVLSAGGTTGLRTWEAAAHLAAYLAGTAEGRGLVAGARVLELGAGTGLVALACARAVGAARVVATDGSAEVVEALRDGIFVNGLQRRRREGPEVSAAVLRWGRYPEVGGLGPRDFDVVVGADIVSDGR